MKNKKIGYSIIILFIVVLMILYVFQNFALNKCAKFTICYPIATGSVGGVVKGGSSMDYLYYVDLKKYESSSFLDKSVKKLSRTDMLNKRYFIRYSCDNNDISEVLWNITVTDTLQYIPTNGWDKIPYGLEKSK